MVSKATSVEEYLAGLPEDRRAAIQAVREVILANKPDEVEEGIQYGHIGYFVPHSRYPDGYHCDPKEPLPYLGIASQKSHMAIYMFCMYVCAETVDQFKERYIDTGKKLDMGAACVRFKKLADLPLELIGLTVKELPLDYFVARYEANIPASKKKRKSI